MHLASTVPELEALERRFQEICSELVYRPGSLFRLASQYLPAWGIGAAPGNEEYIETRSCSSYYDEWKRGTKESNDAIKRAGDNARLPYSNPDLNLELGMMAAEIIHAMAAHKDRIVVADMGAGAGDTTAAVLDFLDMADGDGSVVSKCHFYLLEPSLSRLAEAKKVLESHSVNSKAQVAFTLVASNHRTHMPMLADGAFDMVVTNAVCHHMSFPTYLHQIREKLAGDGVLVMGDWYTPMWKHPAFVLELLRELGMSREGMERFEFLFGIKKGDMRRLEGELEPYQRESIRMMIEFEVHIATEFRRVPEESRLFFLEAHETLEDRLAKMAEAGFETDLDELRARHRDFARTDRTIMNLFPKSDFATVVAGAKVAGHSPAADKAALKSRIKGALVAPL